MWRRRAASGHAAPPVRISVHPGKVRQEFQGLGCGTMFYEGHITSLGVNNKNDRQCELYDDMFAKVNTRYLHLLIRATHEPANDNADPRTPAFDRAKFKYCEHPIAIAKAAPERRPGIELLATILTPPPWMKTNNEESAKGKATLKPKLELEYAEYLWALLAHMVRNGYPVKYLAISCGQLPSARMPWGAFRWCPAALDRTRPIRPRETPAVSLFARTARDRRNPLHVIGPHPVFHTGVVHGRRGAEAPALHAVVAVAHFHHVGRSGFHHAARGGAIGLCHFDTAIRLDFHSLLHAILEIARPLAARPFGGVGFTPGGMELVHAGGVGGKEAVTLHGIAVVRHHGAKRI